LQRRSLGLQGVMPHYVLVLQLCEPHAPHYLLVLQLCESQCLLGLQPHVQCCGTNDVVAEVEDGAFWDRETEEVREREAEEVREREAPRTPRTPQGLVDQVEM